MPDTDSYLYRMGKNVQFRRIGVQPKWIPGTGDIDGFIHDEVVRQYHDPRIESDGGVRITWMKNAWEYAQSQSDGPPTVETMLRVAGHVEPRMNKNGFREHDVQVGNRLCPHFVLVPKLVERLFGTVEQVVPKQGRTGFYENSYYSEAPTADDFYLEFERIHPFGDGNGRTGKILHNWLLGTLDEPVLVDDYFGGGNP